MIRSRETDPLAAALLTVLRMIQALALELSSTRVRGSPSLGNGGWDALLDWTRVPSGERSRISEMSSGWQRVGWFFAPVLLLLLLFLPAFVYGTVTISSIAVLAICVVALSGRRLGLARSDG